MYISVFLVYPEYSRYVCVCARSVLDTTQRQSCQSANLARVVGREHEYDRLEASALVVTPSVSMLGVCVCVCVVVAINHTNNKQCYSAFNHVHRVYIN